jgi:hypothetical protein
MQGRATAVVIAAQQIGRRPLTAARTAAIALMGLPAAIALTARLPTIADIPRRDHMADPLRPVATRLHAAIAAVVVVITGAAEAAGPTVEAAVVAPTAVEVAATVVEAAVTTKRIS